MEEGGSGDHKWPVTLAHISNLSVERALLAPKCCDPLPAHVIIFDLRLQLGHLIASPARYDLLRLQ